MAEPASGDMHAAVRALVVSKGLRAAGLATGVSRMGLNEYVRMGKVGPQNAARLEAWFEREGAAYAAALPTAPDVATLREAVRLAVQATSIRRVAQRAKVTRSGLESFLDLGHTPRERTVVAFRIWYANRDSGESEPPKHHRRLRPRKHTLSRPGRGRADALTRMVKATLTPRPDEVRAAVVALLRAELERDGVDVPDWLRASLSRGPGA